MEAARRSSLSQAWASGEGNSRHLETFSCNKQAQSKAAFQHKATVAPPPPAFPFALLPGPGAAKGAFVFPEKQNKTEITTKKISSTLPHKCTQMQPRPSLRKQDPAFVDVNKDAPWLACSSDCGLLV